MTQTAGPSHWLPQDVSHRREHGPIPEGGQLWGRNRLLCLPGQRRVRKDKGGRPQVLLLKLSGSSTAPRFSQDSSHGHHLLPLRALFPRQRQNGTQVSSSCFLVSLKQVLHSFLCGEQAKEGSVGAEAHPVPLWSVSGVSWPTPRPLPSCLCFPREGELSLLPPPQPAHWSLHTQHWAGASDVTWGDHSDFPACEL